MPLSSVEREKHIARYSEIMSEIKERIFSVGQIIDGRFLPNRVLARDFCYLQLRMVCECIALSCLIAHGELESIKTPKFQKEYSADTLMKMLEELHEDFFPFQLFWSILSQVKYI